MACREARRLEATNLILILILIPGSTGCARWGARPPAGPVSLPPVDTRRAPPRTPQMGRDPVLRAPVPDPFRHQIRARMDPLPPVMPPPGVRPEPPAPGEALPTYPVFHSGSRPGGGPDDRIVVQDETELRRAWQRMADSASGPPELPPAIDWEAHYAVLILSGGANGASSPVVYEVGRTQDRLILTLGQVSTLGTGEVTTMAVVPVYLLLLIERKYLVEFR